MRQLFGSIFYIDNVYAYTQRQEYVHCVSVKIGEKRNEDYHHLKD